MKRSLYLAAALIGIAPLISADKINQETVSFQIIAPSDILINEILTAPKDGGVEFVEIYNYSDKTLDLQALQIARLDKEGHMMTARPISNDSHLMPPRSYRVLSTDPEKIKQQYHTGSPETFITLSSMPVLPNDEGTLVLVSQNTIIDRLDYRATMHSPFIRDPKGVSLERRRFDLPTNAPGNFTSAAAAVNYATPGYRNSQSAREQAPESPQNDEFWLSSQTCSPDNDGFEDRLQLNYHLNESGYMANIVIYNDRGTAIRHLAQNYLLAIEGQVEWDGLNDNGQLAQVGIYIVWIELYNNGGKLKHYRKSCAVAKTLD